MIQDLDGTVPKPAQRWRIAALSAATAAASLVLLLALVLPPEFVTRLSQPSPRPFTLGYDMTSTPLHHLRLDLTRDSVCPDGTRLIPPYHLTSDGSRSEIFAVRYVVTGVARAVRVQLVFDEQTSYWIVACGTFATGAPWTDR